MDWRKITTGYNTVYTSCGFSGKLQVQFPLAMFVMVDKNGATQSRTLHTLTVIVNAIYINEIDNF